MPDPLGWTVLVVGALVGSLIGGVAGFGTGIIMLPLVAWALGIRSAVPILTVAMLVGNLSRIWWSRGEVDRAVVVRFTLGAVPATALGTAFFAGAPAEWLGRFVGVFLLSAMVVTTGPVNTPFFLAYGLRRTAFVGTEAVCSMAMHLARGATLARYSLLTREALIVGLVLGGTMFLGTWAGRRLLERMSDRVFLGIIEAMLVLMGLHSLLFPR